MIFSPVLDPWRTLAALGLEAAVGYPDRLHQLIPHPVTWAGRGIAFLERSWNRPEWPAVLRRALGVATLLLIACAAALAGWVLDSWLLHGFWPAIIAVLLATTGLAQRSLYTHVASVSAALGRNDLDGARRAVSMIVGRDVAALDEGGVAAAALESLAESFCDGVIAPAFWLLACGLAGLFAYKAVNTADSLIGHREPRWRAFGWASARTDDVLNLIPARLAGILLVLAAGRGWRVMMRDASKHDSPNAGWSEAAMAGGLNIRLGGPVAYDGEPHPRPWFGDGARPDEAALRRGLIVYKRACVLFWLLLAAGGLIWRH